jgi:hypothetical protein
MKFYDNARIKTGKPGEDLTVTAGGTIYQIDINNQQRRVSGEYNKDTGKMKVILLSGRAVYLHIINRKIFCTNEP